MDFTYSVYRELLTALKEGGRPVVPFRDVPVEGPWAILRHDVDFSLEQAVRIAEVDADCGVRATFFIMYSSRYYSPFSPEHQEILGRILDLGHEIGLHFDATDFDAMPTEEARGHLRAEAELLGRRLGTSVSAVAQHKPGNRFRHLAPDGFADAYSSRFFAEIGYISDSRGRFREPDPLGFVRSHPRLQLLIHAEWWSQDGLTRREALERVVEEIQSRTRRAMDGELRNLGIDPQADRG
jgi:peptidoglycan/xylan/chitin deacetylase (PgdA/CDA1 family)